MPKGPKSQLPPKQEKFCQEYTINGGIASDAYRKAYYTKDMKDKSIHECACRLLKSDKVASRIVALQAPVSKKYEITREFITSKVMKVVEYSEKKDDKTLQPNNPELLLRSSMELSKLHGLNVEKTPVGIGFNLTQDSLTAKGRSRVDEILKAVITSISEPKK